MTDNALPALDGDPDELLPADYHGRRFLVPRGQYLETARTVTEMAPKDRMGYLVDTFDQDPRPPTVGLYDWASESADNAPFVETLFELGLRARLASAKKAGEVMGSTALPIAYLRADLVLNKTEFARAAERASADQDAAGNGRVARAVREVAGLRGAHRRAFVVGFREGADPDGNAAADPRTVVGLFCYKEPRRKVRGPEAAAMPPEALAARFRGLQVDEGRAVAFDLGGLVLEEAGQQVAAVLDRHARYLDETGYADGAFDADAEAPIDLTD